MKYLIIITSMLLPYFAVGQEQTDTNKLVEQEYQITFFTPFGTNGWDYEQYVNKASINLLAGSNGAVDGLELGGFWNSDKYYMKGFQASGFGNSVGTDVNGIQLAGFTNIVKGQTEGLQAAGFNNFVGKGFNGLQLAGFANTSLDSLRGLQAAGFGNFIKSKANGVQASGFINTALGNSELIQATGFVNVNGGDLKGGQGAGFVNVNKADLKGVQASGFLNVNGGELKGLQASGFINVTKKLEGVQLGLINVADTVNKGVQIGLLSINRNGLNRVEILASETFYGEARLKLGMPRFYNIFSIGSRLDDQGFIWGLGYGIGTGFELSQKLELDMNLSSHLMSDGAFFTTELNNLNRVTTGVTWKLNDKLGLYAGASLNVALSELYDDDADQFRSRIAPYSNYTEVVGSTQVKVYPGFNIGLSIL